MSVGDVARWLALALRVGLLAVVVLTTAWLTFYIVRTNLAVPRTPSLEIGYLFASSPGAPSQELPLAVLVLTGAVAVVSIFLRHHRAVLLAGMATMGAGLFFWAFGLEGNLCTPQPGRGCNLVLYQYDGVVALWFATVGAGLIASGLAVMKLRRDVRASTSGEPAMVASAEIGPE